MKKAILEIVLDKEEEAEIIFKSVYPEVKKNIPKTSVELSRKGKILVLEIESKDTSSLRAACNSFLRWIETSKSVIDSVETG